ncbi:MAG: 3-keto-5-aminohexanoate cleavage protein [Candidatus Acidiferrales bacterium]
MLIEVALNGGRTRAEHPGVPCTPQELAAAARESVAAGAGAAHFHVRGADGRESLEAEDVARTVAAVRAAIPGTPFGVSTGLWIVPDARERHAKVAAWRALPDFASVNFNEEGGIALAELLLVKGMGLEAGMGSVLAAEKFLESKLGPRCRWVLLEPEQQETSPALEVVAKIEALLRGARVALPIVLHGVNRTAWELIDVAAQRGYDTRIGLEDALTLPDGSLTKGNGELVTEAVKRSGRAATTNKG